MQAYGLALDRRLGEEVEYPINYNVTGALRLGHSRERMQEFAHVAAMARANGVEMDLCTPAELQALNPFIELHELAGGLWDPLDGDIDPAQVTQALAKGARTAGGRILRFCPATGVPPLLLVDEEGETPMLRGIITDRDLRTRALSEALASETPISEIMSEGLITIRSSAFIFEAMLTMLHNNVHHLPVMDRDEVRGVIALSDIVKYERQNSLPLVRNHYHHPEGKGRPQDHREGAAP